MRVTFEWKDLKKWKHFNFDACVILCNIKLDITERVCGCLDRTYVTQDKNK